MILTRKIELRVLGASPEEKNGSWKYLRELSKDVFKAYNLVVSHQYFNDTFTERIRKTDPELKGKNEELDKGIAALTLEMKKCKDKEAKEELSLKRKKLYKAQAMLNKDARIKAEQLYITSETNSTYQLLNQHFPDMPSAIKTTVNQDAVQGFKNDIFEVRAGKKSLRTYRDGVPIPFDKTSMRFYVDDKKEICMNWLKNISFALNFGRDKSNNQIIIERAMSGAYKYSNSKIQIDDNKIFLLFCVDIPQEKTVIDPNLSVGVNLGIVVPAYCSLSKGKERLAIGDINDLFRVRIQMQERRKRLQKQLVMAKGGHGRSEKLKALDSLTDKERHFVRTYNHMVSSRIIGFALKHGAGVIKMELLEGYGDDERNKLILRNWSYFELHSMVEYKAKKYGMVVQYTDPHRISGTCNCCGEFNELNLETRNDFVCKNVKCDNFNVKVFSDYNASLNNAQSLKIVTKKEECEYYRIRHEQKV